MTDAPERTWIKPFDECAGPHDWYVAITSGGVEYIRADLHQSALDRAAKADAEFVDMRLELLSALGEAGANLDRAVKAEAEVARLTEALRSVLSACDEGRMSVKPGAGVGGMTLEANIRGSVYNGVPAWPIEEARAALEDL